MKRSIDFAIEQLGQCLLTISALNDERTCELLLELAITIHDEFDDSNCYVEAVNLISKAVKEDQDSRNQRLLDVRSKSGE